MGKTLKWRIPPKNSTKEHSIARHGLKYLLAKKFWKSEGDEYCDPVMVDKNILPYLEGVADADDGQISGQARQLISAILKHGEIEILITEE